MAYKTNDTENVLPVELHERAISYAREKTGLQRPHSSQRPIIDAFRDCFKTMQELGMVKEEFMHVESSDGRKEDV